MSIAHQQWKKEREHVQHRCMYVPPSPSVPLVATLTHGLSEKKRHETVHVCIIIMHSHL